MSDSPFIKVKRFAQRKATAGWNQHTNKYIKRISNKVIRRILRQREQEYL